MKKHVNSIIGAVFSMGIIVFLASCLNPIGFDPSNIQLKIDAKVSGEVDVRSTDSAILWVINRTNSVDVATMSISRTGTETKIVTGKPARASTHASYHEPTDIPYQVDITYKLRLDNTNTAYTEANSSETVSIEKYMPKAGANYRIYLYRANDGQVVVVEDETISRPLDPSDTENPIEPPAADTPTYPLIIRNVTSDINIKDVTFSLEDGDLVVDGPRAKDEMLWYFAAGQYSVSVSYYVSGVTVESTVERNVPIIKPNDSQSWHTLYLWFYKTKTGGYATTTTWPPNPNDAADVNISDVAGPGNGILQIINKSESSDVIQKIRIDGAAQPYKEISFGTSSIPSFTKDMEWMEILKPGIHTVEFMPSRQNYYGMTLTVEIREGEVTTVSYYDRLADPDLPPPDGGYGSGLIKIINNSTGVVNSVFIRDINDNNTFISYNYEQFTPPDPINYNKTGRVGVVGDGDFPVTAGAHYLIQVSLVLPDERVVIERLAALKDQVVEIVINEEEIHKVHGANITLENATSAKPVQITSVTLRNSLNPGEASSFSGQSWSPPGNVNPGLNAGFRVNSSINMPIRPDYSFNAYVAITGNGVSAVVTKTGLGTLYDTSRTITITDSDVPDFFSFKPVEKIEGIPSTLTSAVHTSDSSQSSFGKIDLNTVAIIAPNNATVQGPITWAITGGSGFVSLDNGVLRVIPTTSVSNNSETVKVTATIPGAGVNKTLYTQEFTITLYFVDITTPTTKPVTSINVIGGSLELLVGQTGNLNSKVQIVPSDAIVGGIPVTVADITWSVTTGASFVSIVNSNYASGNAAGTAQVTGTIPAARAGTTDKTVSVTVNVSAPPVTSKTLRFIRAAGIDTLEAIVLVNTNYNGFATVYTPSPSAASNYTAYLKENSSNTTAYTGQNTSNQPLLWQTGQTGVPWMNADNKTLYTNNDKFRKAFMLGLDVTYLDIKLKHGNNSYNIDTRLGTASEIYGDYEVVLGPEGENKYFIFFMEGDKNRGTSDGSFNPTKVEENFYFFVDLDKLPEVTRNGEKVVPIFYDSGTNVASIGINFTKSPAANRKYPPLKHNNYKTAYSFDAE